MPTPAFDSEPWVNKLSFNVYISSLSALFIFLLYLTPPSNNIAFNSPFPLQFLPYI